MAARSLKSIAAEMESLTEERGDPEATHSRADDLLVEAIQWLSAGLDHRAVEDLSIQLVSNWRRIEKWYA